MPFDLFPLIILLIGFCYQTVEGFGSSFIYIFHVFESWNRAVIKNWSNFVFLFLLWGNR